VRVTGREIVRPGDHLDIGPVRFVVEYELSPAALEQLSRIAAPALVEAVEEVEPVEELEPVEEVEEIVEVAEVPQAGPHEEVLELVDNAEEFVPVQEVKPKAKAGPDFELGDADQWYLPPADELRDILSQLDDPEPPRKKRD